MELETRLCDKKNDAGVIKLILLKAIGNAYVDATIPADRIHAFLSAEPHSHV